ncbi:hypothetical protein PF004_g24393 [Phytophthora fragariae]|nr:hypothetical protein PF004_g24393 [Phytophthora fragariae]
MSYLAASTPVPAVPDLESNTHEQRASATKSEEDLSEYKGSVNAIRYILVFWRKIPVWEKAICITIATVCGIVGFYVMIYAGKNLFNPDDSSATFPYCSAEYQDEPYYVRNSTASN